MTKSKLYLTVFTAALASNITYAEPTVTGKITHESAKFTGNGNLIGNTSTGAVIPASKDVFKSETNARIYVDGELPEITDETTYHFELQAYTDSQAISAYDSNESYTQREGLREAYIDTSYDDWLIRAGKQQVVWGTADGIKLLDAINPTDYSELVQNQMEDSRIPVWMLNAERIMDDGSNHQFIVSQNKENHIPGLNETGDTGHAFIMKGVDSITGKRNGFYHVAPNLAAVAGTFDFAASNGGFATSPTTQSNSLATFTSMTVDGFAGNTASNALQGGYDSTVGAAAGLMLANGQSTTVSGTLYTYDSDNAVNGNVLLEGMAENGANGDPSQSSRANNDVTNLSDSTWNASSPTSAFEYMPLATFATFNTMAGATSSYVRDYPSSSKPNFGYRYKDTLDNGLNFSLNFMRRYDANPYIDLDWYDKSSGEKLTAVYVKGGSGTTGLPVDSSGVIQGTEVTASGIPTSVTSRTQAQADAIDAANYSNDDAMIPFLQGAALDAVTLLLKDSDGNYYGSKNWSTTQGNNSYNDVDLRFTEKLNEVDSLGGSLDYSFDTDNLGPVVIRVEGLYTKDEMMPLVDKKVLAIGDLANALSMKKSDTFKYVLGADFTALTNMMVSTQFIQMRNLDFEDTSATCTSQLGSTFDCSKYTADMATLHMSNGLNKGKKNKEFYSLYLSKPFGESGQHRWNNIFMFEEGGGKWNRLDAEYTLDDNTVLTAEYNKYFGDENTQFGQFKNSSNVQLGVKYTF